jgi:hypothetical protein
MVINPSQMEMGMLILMLVRRPRATAGGVLRRRHHRTSHLARPREVVRYESFLEKGGIPKRPVAFARPLSYRAAMHDRLCRKAQR